MKTFVPHPPQKQTHARALWSVLCLVQAMQRFGAWGVCPGRRDDALIRPRKPQHSLPLAHWPESRRAPRETS